MASINSTVDTINSSVPIFGGVIDQLHNFFGILQWIVGGAVGIYVIFSIIKYYQMRNVSKTLLRMQKQLDRIEKNEENMKKKINNINIANATSNANNIKKGKKEKNEQIQIKRNKGASKSKNRNTKGNNRNSS